MVDIDVFHLLWKDRNKHILSIMDEYSRYEVDVIIAKENADEEIRALEQSWFKWAGPPKTLRLDVSGSISDLGRI